MIKKGWTYVETTGEITGYLTCPENHLEVNLEPGESFYEGEANMSDYILNGVAIPRPESPVVINKNIITADTVDNIVISNIPEGATITLIDPEYCLHTKQIFGGSETFNTDLIGAHKIKIEAFPHLDWEGSFDGV